MNPERLAVSEPRDDVARDIYLFVIIGVLEDLEELCRKGEFNRFVVHCGRQNDNNFDAG